MCLQAPGVLAGGPPDFLAWSLGTSAFGADRAAAIEPVFPSFALSPTMFCAPKRRDDPFPIRLWNERPKDLPRVHSIGFFASGALLARLAFRGSLHRVVGEEHFDLCHDRIELVKAFDVCSQQLFAYLRRQAPSTDSYGIFLHRGVVAPHTEVTPPLDEVECRFSFPLLEGAQL
ncbi:hypothetical protein Taro_030444 [Colocasia esculenta]|uniref:Uncharacterized protein n=1 Tax=Colocasia esculenta TaxID=4460 RepID=A0A843VP61_COLES|nr:hypothetical protein [Colocasia esculenta]